MLLMPFMYGQRGASAWQGSFKCRAIIDVQSCAILQFHSSVCLLGARVILDMDRHMDQPLPGISFAKHKAEALAV